MPVAVAVVQKALADKVTPAAEPQHFVNTPGKGVSGEVEGVRIENIYRIQIMNASENPMKVQMKATGLNDLRILNSQGQEVTEINVGPASNQLMPIKVSTNIGQNESGNYPIHFDVTAQEQAGNEIITRTRNEKSSFIIPR